MKRNRKWMLFPAMGALASVLSACVESQGVDINMDDVTNVLINIRAYLIVIAVALVVMILVMIAAGKMAKPAKTLTRKTSLIAFLAVLCVCLNMIVLGPVYSLINLALGDKISLPDDLKTQGAELTETIANEGIVLLENDGLKVNRLFSGKKGCRKIEKFQFATGPCQPPTPAPHLKPS